MRRTWSAMGAVEVFAPVARGLSKRAQHSHSSRSALLWYAHRAPLHSL